MLLTPGTLGKIPHCQIAISVHAASDTASAVVNWRLIVPESWDDTCVPGPDGKPVNSHARRLHQQPVTLDQTGAENHMFASRCCPPSGSTRSAGGAQRRRSRH